MQVESATLPSTKTITAPKTESSSKTVSDYDSFLQLLIAQVKNQDPTNPADATQFVAQLATFSSVEQAVKTNSKLDELISSNSLAQANSLIGKTITTGDGKTSGQVAAVRLASGITTAILTSGAQVAIGDGVTISQ